MADTPKHPRSGATRGGGLPPHVAQDNPLKSCLETFKRTSEQIAEMREILYGGKSGTGVIHIVRRLGEQLEQHVGDADRRTGRIEIVLFGENGDEGLAETVRNHDTFIGEQKDRAKWTNRLLIAQLVAILVFVLKSALGI